MDKKNKINSKPSLNIGCMPIVLIIILFAGEPDLIDVLIELLQKLIEKI